MFWLKNAMLFFEDLQNMCDGAVAEMIFFGKRGNPDAVNVKVINHQLFYLNMISRTYRLIFL
jgi:hypothetical protein